MKYNKDLHNRIRQNLRMFDYPRFDDGDIDALLDEIEQLQSRIAELEDALKAIRTQFFTDGADGVTAVKMLNIAEKVLHMEDK